jgi:hypothetical protein
MVEMEIPKFSSDEVHLVPREWTTAMATQAEAIAHRLTQDPERRAAIVGILFLAWPKLLDASKSGFTGPLG